MKNEDVVRKVPKSEAFRYAAPERIFELGREIRRAITVVIVLVLTHFFMSGCAASQEVVYRTVYKEVLVPAPCEVLPPAKPVRTDSPVINTIDMVEYTKAVEIAFRACRGE